MLLRLLSLRESGALNNNNFSLWGQYQNRYDSGASMSRHTEVGRATAYKALQTRCSNSWSFGRVSENLNSVMVIFPHQQNRPKPAGSVNGERKTGHFLLAGPLFLIWGIILPLGSSYEPTNVNNVGSCLGRSHMICLVIPSVHHAPAHLWPQLRSQTDDCLIRHILTNNDGPEVDSHRTLRKRYECTPLFSDLLGLV